MLAKIKEQQKAIKLRKQGFSYSEILQILPAAKSSISGWVHHIKLTSQQRERLLLKAQGAGGRARREQRLRKQAELALEVQKEITKLLKDPFFAIGVALYWAEGNKIKPWNITANLGFSNSDERTILIMRSWFQKFFNVELSDFKYTLHIHTTADVKSAKQKWADIFGIPVDELKVTLKKHSVKMHYKNNDYKGLVQMRIRRSTWILRRLELWIKYSAEFYLQPLFLKSSH